METKGTRNFVKPTLISRHLFCTICQEIFQDPMRVSCGHTFCNKCILEWFKIKKTTCPICRSRIKQNELSKDLIAYNIIGDGDVFCSNSNNGCEWTGPIITLEKHLTECLFAEGRMPLWLKRHLANSQTPQVELEPEAQERVNEICTKAPLIGRCKKKMTNIPHCLKKSPKAHQKKDEIGELFSRGHSNILDDEEEDKHDSSFDDIMNSFAFTRPPNATAALGKSATLPAQIKYDKNEMRPEEEILLREMIEEEKKEKEEVESREEEKKEKKNKSRESMQLENDIKKAIQNSLKENRNGMNLERAESHEFVIGASPKSKRKPKYNARRENIKRNKKNKSPLN